MPYSFQPFFEKTRLCTPRKGGETEMRKAVSKKVIEKEKAFWHELKKATLSKASKFCHK
jgi:hypothetical protein